MEAGCYQCLAIKMAIPYFIINLKVLSDLVDCVASFFSPVCFRVMTHPQLVTQLEAGLSLHTL